MKNLLVRSSMLLGLSLLVLPLSQPAHAIGDQAALDANHFHPAPGSGKILTTDLGEVGPLDVPRDQQKGARFEFVPQLFLHYARRPLVYTLGGEQVQDLVRDRLTGDISLSFSFLQRLQLALSLPVTFFQQQGPYTGPMGGEAGFPQLATIGQEDLRFSVKGVIYNSKLSGRQSNLHYGFAAMGDLSIPTGNADSFLGSRLPTFGIRLGGHLQYKRLTVGANFGGLIAKPEEIKDTLHPELDRTILQTGYGLLYNAGAQIALWHNSSRETAVYLLAEVFGRTHYPFDNLKASPAEATAAFRIQHKGLNVYIGGGPGINPGYGVPDGRVYAGVNYVLYKKPKPPTPVPPPPPPAPPVEPAKPPEVVPPPPAPVEPPAKAKIETNQINVAGQVYFDFDKDTFKGYDESTQTGSGPEWTETQNVLDAVVLVMKNNPEITLVEVEGHTDNHGTDKYNLELGQRRAEQVVKYLVEHGVETNRLQAKSFGFRCGLKANNTEEDRAINRRVEFTILMRNGQSVETRIRQCIKGTAMRKPTDKKKGRKAVGQRSKQVTQGRKKR